MCGIFGIIRHRDDPLTPAQRAQLQRFVTTLAVTSASRGTDATGLAAVNRHGRVELYKDVCPSYDIVRRERWQEVMELVHADSTFAVLGHTRYKTTGPNTRNNAHPFEFVWENTKIVGVHNGTIYNHEDFGPEEKFEVDSANFLFSLAKEPYASWRDVLEAARGNFAVALASPSCVALARNEGSPCYVSHSRELRMTVFASTEHMLWSAEALSGIALEQVRQLAPGRLALFRPGSRNCTSIHFDPKVSRQTTIVAAAANVTLTTPEAKDTRLYMCTDCFDLKLYSEMVVTKSGTKRELLRCWQCHVKHFKGDKAGITYEGDNIVHTATPIALLPSGSTLLAADMEKVARGVNAHFTSKDTSHATVS